MKVFVVLTFSLLAAACVGPLVEVHDTASDDSLKVYSAQNTPIDYEVIGEIQGFSCKNKIWDSAPSNQAALAQLRESAAKSGADGIINVSYLSGGFDLAMNCWSSITATGTAIRQR
jgi:uncharacterized protein YbjQ (UPF0145 family)